MQNMVFSISGLLLFFTSSILIIILFRFGKTYLHRTWGFFNIAVAIWGFSCYFIGKEANPYYALIWWRISQVGVIFIPILLYHVVFLLCNFKTKRFLYFAYFQGVIFLLFVFTPSFYPGVRFVFSSFYYATPGPAYHFFTTIWLFLVFYCHYLLFIEFKKSRAIRKNQILYFFFGSIVGFSGGIINFLVGYGIDIYPFGNFTIPIYCIIVTYAIVRYRLMDISLVVTRTSIFITVYSLVLGVPFIIASALRPYLVGFFGDKWWLVPMGLLTVLATAGPFIFIYVNKKAEDRLLQEQRQYQNTLRQASSGMIRVRELKKLLNLIVHVVTKTVKLEFASIFLMDPEGRQYQMAAKRDSSGFPKSLSLKVKSPLIEQLHLKREPIVYEEIQLQAQDNPQDSKIAALEKQLKEILAAVVVPSYVGNKLLGFIVLGKKLSGKIYSQDDLNVFSVLANQMALSIENALSYEELKDTKSQLTQLEKLAMTGKLAHQVAHEIKNPLTAIKTFTEYLDEKYELKEFRQKFKQVVGSEIDRLQKIVSQLMDMSKPAKPQLKDNIDVHQIIESTIILLENELLNQGISLRRKFNAEKTIIKADPDQLKQCFLNLILNSVQAMEDLDREKEIIISTENQNKKLIIKFSDTGRGIPEIDISHIFEPFFTTKDKGSGLGLSIVRDIILAHNGKISCQSQIDKGTTFIIELPLV